MAGAAYLGLWGVLLAWLFGVACFYPFFAALRQLLEHRGETADAAVDYAKQPHGAVTRLFGDGPFSSTFGAAGVNFYMSAQTAHACVQSCWERKAHGNRLSSGVQASL